MDVLDIPLNRGREQLLHQQIASYIAAGIVRGALAPGASLPKVRDLAHRLRVSPYVVTQAYRDLKAMRLIMTRPGSGTWVSWNPRRQSIGARRAGTAGVRLRAAAQELGFSRDRRGRLSAVALYASCLETAPPWPARAHRPVPIRQLRWYGICLRQAVGRGIRLGLGRAEMYRMFHAAVVWEEHRLALASSKRPPDEPG